MHPDSNPFKAHAIEFWGDFFMDATLWLQDSDISQAAEMRLRRS